jgi:hypothetical protein
VFDIGGILEYDFVRLSPSRNIKYWRLLSRSTSNQITLQNNQNQSIKEIKKSNGQEVDPGDSAFDFL